MELNEVLRRIFGQHWQLIVILLVYGVGVGAALQIGKPPSYTASARVVLDTPDPETRAESAAIADTAKAIATSPSQVADALAKAHVTGRDPVQIAEHRVAVRALGSSGVFELSVSDKDPEAAVIVANALAAQVISARLAVTQGQAKEALDDLDQQITDVNERISYLGAIITSLGEQLAAAPAPGPAESLRARRDQALSTRAHLEDLNATLETRRVSLLSDDSLRPKPTIISRAISPAHADSSGLVPDLVLGALLGLVLGVGLAGLIETLRPTFVGGDALARELHAPLLGTLAAKPDEEAALDHVAEVVGRLQLAADAAALRKVALVAAEPEMDMGPLAERLEAIALGRLANGHAPDPERPFREQSRVSIMAARSGSALQVQPLELRTGSLSNGSRLGLVVVLPSTARKTELLKAEHLLATGNLPLLGLITYPRARTGLRPHWLRAQS
jgi:capsular polysaccharide biosynthesis protein